MMLSIRPVQFLATSLLLLLTIHGVTSQFALQPPHVVREASPKTSDMLHMLWRNSPFLHEMPYLKSYSTAALHQFSQAVVNTNVSEMCMNRTLVMLDDLLAGHQYALRMLDATAKPPPGLLEGNLKWMGSYDECLSVKSANKTREQDFGANFCMLTTKPTLAPGSPLPISETVAVCIPDACNRTDAMHLGNAALSLLSPNSTGLGSAECASDEVPWTVADAVAIFFCVIFLLMAVLGTCYDLYDRHACNVKAFMVNGSDVTIDSSDGELETIERNGSAVDVPDSEQLVSFKNPGAETKAEKTKSQQSLLAFSVLKNSDKLFDISGGQKDIRVLHGIRALSMWWVILGHVHAFYALGFVDNLGLGLFDTILKRWTFQAISNATYSVDTFFFLSGLLVAYLTLKFLKNSDGKMQWLMFYVHRYLRLTPVFAFFMLLFSTLYTHLPRVPQGNYEVTMQAREACPKYWWTNLLYINNFYPLSFGGECMGWVWYLANDMQFYVISPLFVVALYHRPRLGLALSSVAILLSLGVTAFISTYFRAYSTAGQPVGIVFPQPRHLYPNTPGFDYLYTKPYCRISVYLVGIITGYVLYRTDCKPENLRLRWPITVFTWMGAWVVALAVIYGFSYDIAHGVIVEEHVLAFYTTVGRFCWSVSLAWLVIACVHGYGSYIATILEWKFWVPVSRLTYCAYLVHPAWIYFHAQVMTKTLHYDDLTFIYLFIGDLVLSYSLALLLSLLVEAPLMMLEKVVFTRDSRK